jgi:hypothetical protein
MNQRGKSRSSNKMFWTLVVFGEEGNAQSSHCTQKINPKSLRQKGEKQNLVKDNIYFGIWKDFKIKA